MNTRARAWLNFGFSLALHVTVLLLFAWSFAFAPSPAPREPHVIAAVAISEQNEQATEVAKPHVQAQRHEPQGSQGSKAQEITQLETQTQQLEQQRAQEQQKLAELKKRREQLQQEQNQLAAQREAEQQRIAKLKEQRLAALHKQQQAAAAAAKRKQQEEAEAKRKAEQQHLAMLKKQQEEERQRAAAAQQAALERQVAAEAAAHEYARKIAEAKIDYIPAIQRNVEQNWVRPVGIPHGLSCIIHVRMGIDGTVLNAQVVQSSGNTAFDRSAEVAVRKASPLPIPNDPEVASAFRDLDFEFQPSS